MILPKYLLTFICFISASLWVQSVTQVEYPMAWSEVSRLITNFDAFFASKCDLDIHLFNKMEEKEKTKKENEVKRCIQKLRLAEIGRHFEEEPEPMDTDQNDQDMDQNQNADQNQNTDQNPDPTVPLKARMAMNMMLRKVLFALLKLNNAPPLIKSDLFSAAGGEELATLDPKQNLMVLSVLFRQILVLGRDLKAEIFYGDERLNLAQLGDQISLIQLEFYEQIHSKYLKLEGMTNGILISNFNLNDIKWFSDSEHNDFLIKLKWIGQDEEIAGWKLHPPFMNGIHFAEALSRYYNWKKTMEIFETGEDHEGFLEGVKRLESVKSWQIRVPQIIVKIQKQIEAEIIENIMKYRLKLHPKEQLRLEIIAQHRSALNIMQNIVNRKQIDEEKGKQLIRRLGGNAMTFVNEGIHRSLVEIEMKKGMDLSDENRRWIKLQNIENLKHFEGFYYDEETGERMKKLLREYRSKSKAPSTVEAAIEELDQDQQGDLVPRFAEASVANAVGDMLREGESLILIDWCHKNHLEMPLAEIAFLVEKLRQLFYPKITEEEWYEIDFDQEKPVKQLITNTKPILQAIKSVSYQELLDRLNDESFFMASGEQTKIFFTKLINLLDFIVSSYPRLGEDGKKLIFANELMDFVRNILDKIVPEHNKQDVLDNIQKKLFDNYYYGGIQKQLTNNNVIHRAIRDKLENVIDRTGSWYYFQMETIYENKINSEVKMRADIHMKILGHLVGTLGQFIREQCDQQLWKFEKEIGGSELVKKCANKIKNKFGKLANMIRYSKWDDKGVELINLLINVLICEARSRVPGKWACQYNADISNIKISTDLAIHILRGLIKFGISFMEYFGTYALERAEGTKPILMPWKNISFWANESDYISKEYKNLYNSVIKARLTENIDDELLRKMKENFAKIEEKYGDVRKAKKTKFMRMKTDEEQDDENDAGDWVLMD